MKMRKRAAALLTAIVLCCTVLSACGKDGEGMTLTAALASIPESLDPIYAQSVSEQTMIVHLYENLMRVGVDATGAATAVSGIAKSVDQEANTDGTVTYTFRLRSAKWSDGHAVKASDFVYAWQRLADPQNASPFASLLRVVSGFEEARENDDMSLLQVTAKNDTTLVVTLTGNYDWFLTDVCAAPATMPVRQDVVGQVVSLGQEAPAEATELAAAEEPWWSDPTALVVNGPYAVESYEAGTSAHLVSNVEYYGHDKHTGPAAIDLRFTATAEEGEALYHAKEADVVWPLSAESITALAEDETWAAIPTLSTDTLLMNCAAAPFQDQSIRQAVVKALDRNAIAAVAGVDASAADGLVPYGVPDDDGEEDFRTCGGALVDNELYAQNCTQAQEILSAAGYDSGAELGELEYLYVDESSSALVAEEVCRQLRTVLQLQVTPKAMTEEEFAQALESGEFTLAGMEVTGLCNDAESFLMGWTSDSPENVMGYENTAYDTLMSIIATAKEGTARLGCLHDAEVLLLDDAPLTPLYTRGTAWEMREEFIGAIRDARGFFSFTNVVTRTA